MRQRWGIFDRLGEIIKEDKFEKIQAFFWALIKTAICSEFTCGLEAVQAVFSFGPVFWDQFIWFFWDHTEQEIKKHISM
jgi:hypothetical protein